MFRGYYTLFIISPSGRNAFTSEVQRDAPSVGPPKEELQKNGKQTACPQLVDVKLCTVSIYLPCLLAVMHHRFPRVFPHTLLIHLSKQRLQHCPTIIKNSKPYINKHTNHTRICMKHDRRIIKAMARQPLIA